MAEEFLNITQVAERFGVRERVIQRAVDAGTIPHRKIGKALRFRWNDLLMWYDALPGETPIELRTLLTATFPDTHVVTTGIPTSPEETHRPPIPLTRGPRRQHVAPSVVPQHR